jgi:hypothetical protein
VTAHRVLIADDDRAIRESLARALELEGYDVTVVVDGVEARPVVVLTAVFVGLGALGAATGAALGQIGGTGPGASTHPAVGHDHDHGRDRAVPPPQN